VFLLLADIFDISMSVICTLSNITLRQVASVFSCGNEYAWYLLMLKSIRVPGLNMTQSGFSQCNSCDNCYTDSGASMISLPLPESQCNGLKNTDNDTLKKMGSLLIDIEGVNGSTITLSLPLLWLKEQAESELNTFVCSGTSGAFILGFPIFQYYYLAYYMGSKTITFVDLPLSNETEALINGPELGGINESPSSGTTESHSSGNFVDLPPSNETEALINGSKTKESPSSGNHVHSTIGFLAVGSLLLAFQYIL